MALPVCAYIGGWGELAYHAQLGSLRRAAGAPEGAFIPRLSITLSDPDVRASLDALDCSVAEVLAARGEWRSGSEDGERPEVLDDLHSLARSVRDELLDRRSAISEVDRTLAAGLKRAADQLRNTVEKVALKAERAHANRSGKGRRHERRVNHALFPRGGAQERSLGPAPYIARFGRGWVDELLDELDPFALEHIHCSLSEGAEA